MNHTPEQIEAVNALREYEAANRKVMSLSVWSPEGRLAKEDLRAARDRYLEATRRLHPNWIVF